MAFTRQVYSTLYKINGAPLEGGVVRFMLADDTYWLGPDESYPIAPIEVVSDSVGEIAVNLVTDLVVPYRVRMPDGEEFSIFVPFDDGSSISLETLRNLFSGVPFSELPSLTGPQGPQGATGPGVIYFNRTFSTSTTDADPGLGNLRLNNANQLLATQAFIDVIDSSSAFDQTSLLDTLDDSTNPVKGHIRIQYATNQYAHILGALTAVTSATGYRKLVFTIVGSSTVNPFSNGDPLLITFVQAGDRGATGPTGATGATGAAGSAGNASGSNTYVQYNKAGVFGGDSGLTYNDSTKVFTVGSTSPLSVTNADLVSAGTELALAETGDTFGEVRLRIMNRTGLNGLVLEQRGSAGALVDAIYKPSGAAGLNRNIRLENRGGSQYLTTPEFQFGIAGNPSFVTADGGALVRGTLGIGTGVTPTALAHIAAASGAANAAPLKFTAGTNLTTPEAGTVEFDGASWYATQNSTSQRSYVAGWHEFRRTTDGSTFGPAVGDFFGTNSSINLPASSMWRLEAELYFQKQTAGTISVSIVNSGGTFTSFSGWLEIDGPDGGFAFQSLTRATIHSATTATQTFPTTPSLNNITNHLYKLGCNFQMSGAGNLRIRFTQSAGIILPMPQSFYRIRRMPGNTGNFVA